ncbi:class I SAM-dependent methyltransferase [Rhodococcus sp. X156]|uniref:class I SAM-dependent methyltransferase n=1 Tax=Rhodococcus sp. X156 TaxID=2499145 RepID=UPI001F4966ED|nr:class I SAM-dependent methyltransferase [Rhodococcus sp. X156]
MARAAVGRPEPAHGHVTRGTTGINRLRRSDRWITHAPEVRDALAGGPLVVDLGYGASPVTTVELAARLRTVRPDVRVVGLEIDPARVAAAQAAATPWVQFRRGGFELAGLRPSLVRSFNVLRQYDETDVAAAWRRMCAGLAPGGLVVEGTCDELGRRCAWVTLSAGGPQTLTLAWDPFDLATPSEIAPRLPKALIHRNVTGEPVHRLLTAADRCWAHAAPHAVFGPRVRWRRTLELLRAEGVPVRAHPGRQRDCVLTVPWAAVAPTLAGGAPAGVRRVLTTAPPHRPARATGTMAS